MSRRTILSRPRTRVYNANYDIGQSYYQPAIDRLDRKYSGRTLSPVRSTPTVNQDILDRHQRAFNDEDLNTSRRRAEQHITEDNIFDSRSHRRPLSTSFACEDEFDDEISNTLRKIRARKSAIKVIDDVDLESTVNNISFNRMINKTDKLMDAVGLNERSASRIFEEEPLVRKRISAIKFSSEDNSDNRDMTRWSKMSSDEDTVRSAASIRAKQSRARLDDIDDEMEAMAEKTAARERRRAHLKNIMAENAEESEAMDSALKSVHTRISKRAAKISSEI